MKTNRFEKTLRQKLESIQPDFQDQDWTKLQSHQQLHAPQNFWQTSGHWIGYAAAAITTAAMVILYVHQSNQNDRLMKELVGLKQQISMNTQARSEAILAKPDTIYIIQREEIFRDRPLWAEVPVNSKTEKTPDESFQVGSVDAGTEIEKNGPLIAGVDGKSDLPSEEVSENTIPLKTSQKVKTTPTQATEVGMEKKVAIADLPIDVSDNGIERVATVEQPTEGAGAPPTTNTNPSGQTANAAEEPIQLSFLAPIAMQKPITTGQYHQRHLLKRMPYIATAPQKIAEVKSPKSTESTKAANKSERLLPAFNLNIPYRIGLGQQWEGRTNAFSVWNEVLLNKHWSLQGGISRKNLEDQRFISEKTFRDFKKEDFREGNAQRLPPNFKIFNIVTKTTLTQIPLSLAYRDDISKDFSYFLSAGTNLNIRAKQLTSFDFERPTSDFGQQSNLRKAPAPIVDNLMVSAGIEKRWNPIILQVDSYVSTHTKAMPYLNDRTSVGLRAKILYEFGGTGKK